ncbi:MAG: matrixin family metalloprotease [Planctomycetota bacterium]
MRTYNSPALIYGSVIALSVPAIVFAQQVCSCGYLHNGPCRLWIDETDGGERPYAGPQWYQDLVNSGATEGEFGGAGSELQIRNRWGATASNPSSTAMGSPVTLTWGFVRDGATLPSEPQDDGTFRRDPSDLIALLDTRFGSGGQTADLTTRPWFSLFESAYERWESISGLTFNYEPNDDGQPISGSTASSRQGRLGVRADMRVAGHFIDGQVGGNVLAYNYFPQAGDMVIDTSNTSFYGNPSSNFIRLRNTVMHEIGHGLGFNHLESNNSSQLMEPFINTSFDGPQIDDILAAQRNYGDAWEKNGGNDSARRPTAAGTIDMFTAWAIGTDGELASPSTRITPDQVDFVSIDDRTDLDHFSFTAEADGLFDFRVIPVGPTYNSGPQGGTQSPFATSALSRLGITIFDSIGNVVANRVAESLGETITIDDVPAAAGETLIARVEGLDRQIQLYRLDAALNPGPGEGATFDLTGFDGASFDNAALGEDGAILRLNAGRDDTDLSAQPGGFGVLSPLESLDSPLSQIGPGETIEFSFDTPVILESLQLTGLATDGSEFMSLRFLEGVNPFAELEGYEGAYSLGEDQMLFRAPAWQGEGINVAFGFGDQTPLFIEAGTVLSLSSSSRRGGDGFFLRSLTVEVIPEPSTAMMLSVAAAALTRRRRSVVPPAA